MGIRVAVADINPTQRHVGKLQRDDVQVKLIHTSKSENHNISWKCPARVRINCNRLVGCL